VQASSNAANEQLAINNFVFEPLLTDEQAATLLGNMHVKTLQRMARYGHIPAHKIGRFWYFRASELDKWLRGELTSPCQSVRVNEEN
jgi:excisionase family DNA binding protein